MKKKLEADLISIAHRILKLKNKSELLQLHQETQKLYEKLSILKFVEENFGEVKPTIGLEDLEARLESAFAEDAETVPKMPEPETAEDFGEAADEVSEPEIQATEEAAEDLGSQPSETHSEAPESDAEATNEEIQAEAENATAGTSDADDAEEEEPSQDIASQTEIPAAEDAGVVTEETGFKPDFELAFDKKEPQKPKQTSFEDLLSHGYDEPIFVKAGAADAIRVNDHEEVNDAPEALKEEDAPARTPEPETEKSETSPFDLPIPEPKTPQADHFTKAITIGLNDRIGFEKQLFGGSSEDLNRVLSQLNTFDTFQEAQDFIEDMVKPDYNNWEGKDDYAQRFMEIVEKKFA